MKKGKLFTEEHKKNIRISILKRQENINGQKAKVGKF